MIPLETLVEIRRLFFAEHWRMGTIAAHLGLHHETIEKALDSQRWHRRRPGARATVTAPYEPFIHQTLESYPRLRATRIFQMLSERGYAGSMTQLRRVVATLRPASQAAFLRLVTMPGEQAQVDWASFGTVRMGRAERKLSCFVFVLAYCRALYLEFFFDQCLESFLLGHVHAFEDLGVPRVLLVDNLRSAVLDRQGQAIRFHPAYLELCAHYHCTVRPCNVGKGNEKGRVERAVQFIRHSFFAARPFTTLQDFNQKALMWRDQVAHERPWPGDDSRKVADIFQQEKPHLLPLPAHPFCADRLLSVRTHKSLYVRFDLNDYSVPPEVADGRVLTLLASPTTVRILDKTEEVARHRRSWDRHSTVEEPAHVKALIAMKRKALSATPSSRLLSVPGADAFLEAALKNGQPRATVTQRLLALLEQYGPRELEMALREALQKGSPHDTSVLYVLEKRRRQARRPPPVPVCLTHRPELRDLSVTPHRLETYDELAQPTPSDPDDSDAD